MYRKALADGLTVSGQLGLDDFEALARHGVRLVINNRPDGEAPGQPTASEAASAAARAGLGYHHLPVTFATLARDDVERFGAVLAGADGPVHAHCASGLRSATLWALDRIGRGIMTRDEAALWADAHQVDLRPGLAWLDRQPS